MPPKLTPETREAILSIKESCLGRPWYSSYGIYTAVLDHGVRTHQEYRAYVEGGFYLGVICAITRKLGRARGTSWNSGFRQPISSVRDS